MTTNVYELAILGGGPAGAAAGVYAARKKLKSVIIAEEFGGQSKVSVDVQNWIGTPSISGTKLADDLKAHLEAYADGILDIKEGSKVSGLAKDHEEFVITTDSGDEYRAKAILIATGSRRRKLQVPGAEEFDGKGIVYCASCDAPLFAGMDVVVVGGGNAGFETASQLTEYAKSIKLFNHSDSFKADKITVDKVNESDKVELFNNIEIQEIKGDKLVKSVVYKDIKTGEENEIPVGGVFVEIGQIPNTEYAKGLVDITDYGQIKIDPRNQQTSVKNIWAAGDNTDVLYHQNNIAAGDAVRAIEDIYVHLKTR